MLEDLYERFFNALNSKTINAITKIAYEYFNKPITVVDINYNLLCQLPEHHVSDIVFDSILDRREIPQSTIGLLEQGKYRDYLFTNRKVSYVDWGSLTNPRIMGAIEVNHKLAGYFAILCKDAHYTEVDLKVAEIFRLALGIKLENYNKYLLASNELGNVFMRELVNGRLKFKNSVSFWSKYCPDLMKGDYLFSCVRGSRDSESIDLQYIPKELQHKFPNCYTYKNENTLFILFYNINKVNMNPKSKNNFFKGIIHWFEENNLYCGLSTIFSDIMEIALHKFMAVDALEHSINSKADQRVIPFEKYTLNCMIDRIKATENWSAYIHPYLTKLKEYDTKHKTEYFDTLRVYILSFKDMSYTAATLGICRNSVKYRLQKINEILDINYFNNKLCSQLLCNFHMVEEKMY